MITIGTYKRKMPALQAFGGYDPQNPTTLQKALAVTTAQQYDPESYIWSGMLVSADTDGTHWRTGVAATPSNLIGFAVWDSWDFPTRGAGDLVALTCHGKFRLGTAFFARNTAKSGKTITAATTSLEDTDPIAYTTGMALTACKDGEYDVVAETSVSPEGYLTYSYKARSLKGFVRPAKTGEPVIGIVSEQHDGINGTVAVAKATATVPDGVWALQTSVGDAVDSTSVKDNAYLLVIDTTFAPSV